ncbi:PhaM family polyhydroxyalkanoate granule multifunctional regulatory protein [Aquincola tertiaricarbonis]|uniref:PhaM family polyhydroxyalkanoate granule multifunctional regulatory protein n=1 Tax=Aquincola tertiaricarbonis TaxID=391953 RepID=UPI000614F521|nr:PhaM family polyhydroxyalkanoate granule multifunctional regulatory protein [Aquincola tertiaricarbonis]
MADSASPFKSLVPGFDFLQNLVKGAGTAMPSIGQWVAPTLDPAELTKRIDELKTVQFWLEQNARMLAATIQALEVQRMTLSTLKTMNVQVQDLQEAMKIKMPEPAAAPAPAKAAAPAEPAATDEPAAAPAPAGVVDPMQWWGALTKQFTELATEAIKEGSAQAAQVAQMAKLKPGPVAAAPDEAAADAPAAAPARKARPAVKTAARKRGTGS